MSVFQYKWNLKSFIVSSVENKRIIVLTPDNKTLTFKNARQARIQLGLSHAEISLVLNSNLNKYKGYTIRYEKKRGAKYIS